MNKGSKISGKVLVIQLGREETQLVLVGGGKEVLYGTTVSTPIGAVEDGVIRNPEAVRVMLKDAMKEHDLRCRQAVFCLSTSQVITETVTTPDLPAAKLEKLIQANADMYFPVDVKDYQLVWQTIGPKKSDNGLKELLVQLWAVPNGMLAPYYTVANRCGLSVAAIDYCGHAIASAVGASFAAPVKGGKKKPKLDLNMEISFSKKKKELPAPAAEEDDGPVFNPNTDVYLLVDKDLLGMTCVQNGQVVFQRFLRCGGNPSYQLGELAMMLEYFKAMDIGRGSQLRGFYFGEMAGNVQLAEDLADILYIPMGRFDVPYSLHWVSSVGAAHTDLDFGIPALNKPGKARKDLQSSLWQYILILLGGLMLITTVFYLLTARLNWSSNLAAKQAEMMALQVEAQKYNGYADNYENYIAEYNKYSQDWDNIYASLQTYNDNLVLVLDELEAILPEKSSVADMQIGATGLNVTFACEDKEDAAYLIMALRELQYADLLAVSSLAGGGAGPATSYGTGRDTEQAPVEGGSGISAADRDRLAASLREDMAPYMVGYYMGLGKKTPDLLADLADVYGVTPDSGFESIEDASATFRQRTDAFYIMCTTNPFAMGAATDMLYEDYTAGGELSKYLENGIKGEWIVHRSPTDLEDDVEGMLDLIYYNDEYTTEEIFPAVENLLAQYPEAESWYLYYLEGVVNGDEDLPYLDFNAMAEDLGDGQFDSGIKDMNTILTNLLSSDTLAILEDINQAPTEPGGSESTDPSGESTEPGASTEPSETLPPLPVDPSDPFASTGPTETLPPLPTDNPFITEPTVTEPSSEATEPSGPIIAVVLPSVETMMDQFLNTGSLLLTPEQEEAAEDLYGESAVEYLEGFLNQFFTDGTTESETVTGVIQGYLDANPEKEEELREKYEQEVTEPSTEPSDPSTEPSDPSTEPTEPSTEATDPSTSPTDPDAIMERLGQVMESYLETGDTGLSAIEEMMVQKALEQYKPEYAGKSVEEILDDQLMKYFTFGESDVPQFDDIVDEYLTENPDKEAELEAKYKKEVTIEMALQEYLEKGKTNFEERLIKKYIREGDTEVTEYNTKLNAFVEKGGVDAQLKTLLIKYRNSADLIENNNLKKMLENYDADTGNTVLNARLKTVEENLNKDPEQDPSTEPSTEPAQPSEPVQQALKDYLATGTAGADYSNLIKVYLVSGATTDNKVNQTLNSFVSGGGVDAELKPLLKAYMGNPESVENSIHKIMLDNYASGTGNAYINARLAKLKQIIDQENAPKPAEVVVKLLQEYLDKGMKTGTAYDAYIEMYLITGSAGTDDYGKAFTAAMEDAVAKGGVDGALKNLIELYSYNKDRIPSGAIKTMFANYYFGTGTGSKALDARIKDLEKQLLDDLVAELNKKNAEKAAGQPYVKPDTRIFFTVVLTYNDELKLAELERKGLNYEDKIPLIEEVGE